MNELSFVAGIVVIAVWFAAVIASVLFKLCVCWARHTLDRESIADRWIREDLEDGYMGSGRCAHHGADVASRLETESDRQSGDRYVQ